MEARRKKEEEQIKKQEAADRKTAVSMSEHINEPLVIASVSIFC